MLGTYAYDCANCGSFLAFEESSLQHVACPECGSLATRAFTTCAIVVPAHMSARADNVQGRQAAYLTSDRHREDCEKDERIAERQIQFEARKEAELPKVVAAAVDDHLSDPRCREPGYEDMIRSKRAKGEAVA